jgi:hypothetical protein
MLWVINNPNWKWVFFQDSVCSMTVRSEVAVMYAKMTMQSNEE